MFGRYRFQLKQQDHQVLQLLLMEKRSIQPTKSKILWKPLDYWATAMWRCYRSTCRSSAGVSQMSKPLRLKTIILFLHDTLKAEKGVSFYPNLSNTGFVLLMHIKLTTPPHINTVKQHNTVKHKHLL